MAWFGRRKPEENPEVKEAMEIRDALLIEADAAIREVDRVQKALIDEYEEADRQRVKNGRRRR